jgi:hypothetical protein
VLEVPVARDDPLVQKALRRLMQKDGVGGSGGNA